MSAKQQPSLSEVKVGIFVVVACAILAMAIFAIGSRVGMFEDQFWAMTYLSNISGLKPGDIVLLGGVEVGNVMSVQIETAEGATMIVLELSVDPDDMGRVIGKKGQVANAMRTLLRSCAAQNGKRVNLEIIQS